MPRVGQPQARRGVQVQLSASLIELIQDRGLKTGESFDDIVNAALEVYLDGPNTSRRRASLSGRQPVNAVHITAPIITLVEGILRGETTIGEALRYGDFGLGTLNDLDGEVVVFKGTAYQQAADGSSRVLESTENTPFMTMTFLEEEPASVWECPIPSTDEHWGAGLSGAPDAPGREADVLKPLPRHLDQGPFSLPQSTGCPQAGSAKGSSGSDEGPGSF
eukprot:jgi/Botrbrau1/21918/Bobra.0249s0043.2